MLLFLDITTRAQGGGSKLENRCNVLNFKKKSMGRKSASTGKKTEVSKLAAIFKESTPIGLEQKRLTELKLELLIMRNNCSN